MFRTDNTSDTLIQIMLDDIDAKLQLANSKAGLSLLPLDLLNLSNIKPNNTKSSLLISKLKENKHLLYRIRITITISNQTTEKRSFNLRFLSPKILIFPWRHWKKAHYKMIPTALKKFYYNATEAAFPLNTKISRMKLSQTVSRQDSVFHCSISPQIRRLLSVRT